MFQADQLLIFTTLFAQKSTRFLTKFAQHHSLIGELKFLLKKVITPEEFKLWLDQNKTVFGNKENLKWEFFNDQNNIPFLEATQNKKIIKLYLQPINDLDLNISEEAILQSFGSIPKLYLYVGEFQKKRPSYEKYLDPQLSHNDFIIKAIDYLYNLKEKDIELLPEFINSNKEKINQLRSLFAGQPRYIGGGADGVAFVIAPSLVLKIFKSEHNFKEAQKAFDRLHQTPALAKTEAMIYDVGILGHWKGHPLYYYIIEKMLPIKKFTYKVEKGMDTLIKNIAVLIQTNIKPWREFKNQINDPKQHQIIQQKVSQEAEKMEQVIRSVKPMIIKTIEKEIPSLKSEWLKSLIEEILMKYLTSRTDLHLGNLGLTGYGEFRYFDPAYELWTSEINIPTDDENNPTLINY